MKFSAGALKEWTIPADLCMVQKVCDEIAFMITEAGFINEVFPLQVLTLEAMNNAILHGSQMDITKKVNCQMFIGDNSIDLMVTDEGSGFNWQSVMLQEMASEEQESGRGLWIYKMYADKIEFNAQGNSVRLHRALKHKETRDAAMKESDPAIAQGGQNGVTNQNDV